MLSEFAFFVQLLRWVHFFIAGGIRMKRFILILLSIVLTMLMVGCNSEDGASKIENLEIEKINNQILNACEGDIIQFGYYEQDGDHENGSEPIEWTVLDAENNKIFLLSTKLLDFKTFNEGSACYWNESNLKKWLNNEFFQHSFTEEEQKRILTTKLETSVFGNPFETIISEEKLFLMSIEEVEHYFPSRAARMASATEYAASVKATFFDYNTWFTRNHYDVYGGRTHAAVMNEKIRKNAGEFVELRSNVGSYIRPCMWITVI